LYCVVSRTGLKTGIIIPILQLRRLKLSEIVTYIVESQDLNPGLTESTTHYFPYPTIEMEKQGHFKQHGNIKTK
jgi:hypothetical protein